MAFLIGGANSAADTGYNVANSCRFDDSAAHYLTKDQSSSGNARTFTWSGWAKLADIGNSKYLFSDGTASNTSVFININSDDVIDCRAYTSGTKNWDIKSSNLFRDHSAWYHFVVRVDTTQGAANDRVRVYVNGSEIAYGTQTMPDQNYDTPVNSSSGTHRISMDRDTPSAGASHCGYISEVHFVDGASLAPASFAETDEDSGIWKPKNCKADLTYGTNGYFLEFKASAVGSGSASTIGADTSGNTNHFDSSGLAVTDQCTDTPTNNFCTGNPLDIGGVLSYNAGYVTWTEGNTNVQQTSGADRVVGWKASTIGITNGKWYFEIKAPTIGHQVFGVGPDTWDGQDGAHANVFHVYINAGSAKYRNGPGTDESYTRTEATNDIYMFALDLDTPKLWFGYNGTWHASGDPAAGDNPISTQAITDTLFVSGSFYTDDEELHFNLGNPSYAISSSQSDDNGYGNFEYDVPAGFYAICTKNLAKYG